MGAKSILAKSFFPLSPRPAIDAGGYQMHEIAAIDYALGDDAFIGGDIRRKASSCIHGWKVAGRKKAGAMAGQEDNPNCDVIRAVARMPLVWYENACVMTVAAPPFANNSSYKPTGKKKLAIAASKDGFHGSCSLIVAKHNLVSHQSRTKAACLTKSDSVVYSLKRRRRHLLLGIAVSMRHRRTTADWRYFFVRCLAFAFNGRALVGERSRSPVSYVAGTAIPPCARPPQLQLGTGFVEPDIGGRSMRLAIPARLEQIQTPLQIQIINRALRDAALAPSANDALDCCADALLHLAELARAEVRHD